MNRTPSILVDTGFEVDQNGALTELNMPDVVATLNSPSKIIFKGTTINYIPSDKAKLQEFIANNMTSVAYGSPTIGPFNSFTALESLQMNSLETIACAQATAVGGMCYGCINLANVTLPALKHITDYGGGSEHGCFNGCVSLRIVNLPSIISILRTAGTSTGCFRKCTNLTSVTLGSEGHPVTSIDSQAFSQCTQADLTITVYTSDGNSIAGSPWGASNATIVWEEA